MHCYQVGSSWRPQASQGCLMQPGGVCQLTRAPRQSSTGLPQACSAPPATPLGLQHEAAGLTQGTRHAHHGQQACGLSQQYL